MLIQSHWFGLKTAMKTHGGCRLLSTWSPDQPMPFGIASIRTGIRIVQVRAAAFGLGPFLTDAMNERFQRLHFGFGATARFKSWERHNAAKAVILAWNHVCFKSVFPAEFGQLYSPCFIGFRQNEVRLPLLARIRLRI